MSQLATSMNDMEIAVGRSGEAYVVQVTIDGQLHSSVEFNTLDAALNAKADLEASAIGAGGRYIAEVASRDNH